MKELSEGYLFCAFGKKLYYSLCIRAVKNIRLFDNKRPICILTDNPSLVNKYISSENNYIVILFDYTNHLHNNINITNEWNKFGLIPKTFQSLYSPFEKTMFIDVDNIFKVDFTFIWDLFNKCKQPILCGGFADINNRSPPHWHWGYITNIMNNIGINLPAVYSGLIVYDNNFKNLLTKNITHILDNLIEWDVKSYFNSGYPDEIIYSIIFGFEDIKVSEELHNFLANMEFTDACNKTDDIIYNNYDTKFVSIGPLCTSNVMIKNAGLKKESYPFDNIFSSLPMIQHCIQDKFNNFLNDQYIYNDINLFNSLGVNINECSYCSSNKYYENYLYNNEVVINVLKKNNYKLDAITIFRHHNLKQNDTKESYIRKCNRFLDLLSNTDNFYNFIYTILYLNENYINILELKNFSNYIGKFISKYNIYVIHILNKEIDTSMVYNENNIIVYHVATEEKGSELLQKIGLDSMKYI